MAGACWYLPQPVAWLQYPFVAPVSTSFIYIVTSCDISTLSESMSLDLRYASAKMHNTARRSTRMHRWAVNIKINRTQINHRSQTT